MTQRELAPEGKEGSHTEGVGTRGQGRKSHRGRGRWIGTAGERARKRDWHSRRKDEQATGQRSGAEGEEVLGHAWTVEGSYGECFPIWPLVLFSIRINEGPKQNHGAKGSMRKRT